MNKKKPMLTAKKEQFCQEFIKDLNGSEAAKRAGYSAKNYSALGARNLRCPVIQKRIAVLQKDRFARHRITQDQVLNESANIAFNDPRKLFNEDGHLKAITEWTREEAACVSSIKVAKIDTGGEVKTAVTDIRFWDKGRQIEVLCKHLGLLTEKLSIDVNAKITDERLSDTNAWLEGVILRGAGKEDKESLPN